MRTVILIPVYDDWEAAAKVLASLDTVMRDRQEDAEVMLVDDGSTTPPASDLLRVHPAHLRAIRILRLRRNVGHQRAIAVGLAFIEANVACDAVVIMDGDGEDRPEDVPRLLDAAERAGGTCVVFAERTRRSEGPVFLLFYTAYRLLHWLLTGVRVRVGNFSVLPSGLLRRLVASSDLWNHYAAAVFKGRLPYEKVKTSRGTRYAGHGRMDVVALVTHGLSAMSVFGDRIGVRLLAVTAVVAVAAALGGSAVLLLVRPSPSWAPFAIAVLVVMLLQWIVMSLFFVITILAGRDSSAFIPLRDYGSYVAGLDEIPT
jgi:glycosyltransferase involved in cell wall biosynthesis